MFDVGLSEMMVILVVALIVIGPERLPRVARTMGMLWSRAQRYVNGIKNDITRDLDLEDMRLLKEKMLKDAYEAEQAAATMVHTLDQQVEQVNQAIATPLQTHAETPAIETRSTAASAQIKPPIAE